MYHFFTNFFFISSLFLFSNFSSFAFDKALSYVSFCLVFDISFLFLIFSLEHLLRFYASFSKKFKLIWIYLRVFSCFLSTFSWHFLIVCVLFCFFIVFLKEHAWGETSMIFGCSFLCAVSFYELLEGGRVESCSKFMELHCFWFCVGFKNMVLCFLRLHSSASAPI